MTYTAPFHPGMTLEQARRALLPLAEGGGASCPCCAQVARVYRRKLTSVPARALAGLYMDHGREYGHLPTVGRNHLADVQGQGGYLSLAAHWGLMEDDRHRRPDGGRVDLWRVTAIGESWLLGDTSVPMYARIYNGRCLGVEGEFVSIDEVLGGTGFDLSALIAESALPVADEHGVAPLFGEAA